MATRYFKSRKIPFKRVHVDDYPGGRAALEKETNHRTVPQIFIGDHFIGGYDDLISLDKKGQLNEILLDT